MPSGPKKRRAERKKNVLLQVKIEEGLDVKIEPVVPGEVHEPVAARIEPVSVELYDPVVEPPGAGHEEPVVVALAEPVADLSGPAVGVVEPVIAESSVPVGGLVEPVVESPEVGLVEPVAEPSMAVVSLAEPEAESEPVVELHEPIVEPTGAGHVEPVVEPIGASHVEPAVVGQVELVAELSEHVVSLDEPVAESYEPMVGLVEPLAESSTALIGLAEPETVVESFVDVANSTDSCEGIVVVDNGDGSPRKESDQVNGKRVDQPPPPVVEVEENGLVKKSLINGGVKLTKVELGDVKKTIEEQLRVVEQVTVNLRQILANLD